MRTITRLVVALLVLFALSTATAAQVGRKMEGCGCACGDMIEPVNGTCGDEACIAHMCDSRHRRTPTIERICSGRQPSGGSIVPQPGLGLSPLDADWVKRGSKPAQDQSAEEERKRREKQQEEKQTVDERRREALRRLDSVTGGISSGGVGGTTSIFGSRRVGAKDAGLVVAPGAAPSRPAIPFPTAWQQLQCAANIFSYSLIKAPNVKGERDLAEIRYLDQQTLYAIDGSRLEVDCGRAAPLRFQPSRSTIDFSSRSAQFMGQLVTELEQNAETLVRTRAELPAARVKTEAAQQKVTELQSEVQALQRKPPTVQNRAEAKKTREALDEAKAALQLSKNAQHELEQAQTNAQGGIETATSKNNKTLNPDEAEEAFAEIMGGTQ